MKTVGSEFTAEAGHGHFGVSLYYFLFFVCFKDCIRVYVIQIYEVILSNFLMCIRWECIYSPGLCKAENITQQCYFSFMKRKQGNSTRGYTRMKEKTNSSHAHLLMFSTFPCQSYTLRRQTPSLPRMRQPLKTSEKAQKTKIIKTLTWLSYWASNHGRKQC